MYLRTVRSLRWPVCFMIERSGASPSAAEVASPERRGVAGVAIGVEPRQPAGALDDQGHRLLGETSLGQLAVAVDPPKDGPLADPAAGQPVTKGAHRAGLRVLAHGDAALLAGALLVGLA